MTELHNKLQSLLILTILIFVIGCSHQATLKLSELPEVDKKSNKIPATVALRSNEFQEMRFPYSSSQIIFEIDKSLHEYFKKSLSNQFETVCMAGECENPNQIDFVAVPDVDARQSPSGGKMTFQLKLLSSEGEELAFYESQTSMDLVNQLISNPMFLVFGPTIVGTPIYYTWEANHIAGNFEFQLKSKIDQQVTRITRNLKAERSKYYRQLASQNSGEPKKEKRNFSKELKRKIDGLKAERSHDNIYVFAIGIERYRHAPDVPFADRSAKLFASAASKKFGIPEKNVRTLTNEEASTGQYNGYLRSLVDRLDDDDTLIFYYAGHGVPERSGDKAYILPQDAVVGSFKQPRYEINHLQRRLARTGADEVIAFFDSCFSGKSGKDEMVFDGVAPAGRTTRGSVNAVKQSIPDNMVVFTAGTSSQFANSYSKKGHRLFSYFLIKSLLENHTNPEKIAPYLKRQVRDVSLRKGPTYKQTPQVFGNVDLQFN